VSINVFVIYNSRTKAFVTGLDEPEEGDFADARLFTEENIEDAVELLQAIQKGKVAWSDLYIGRSRPPEVDYRVVPFTLTEPEMDDADAGE